jgi:signal transduction histidine kinase/ActR/RegA family two-component response regulator
MKQLLTAPFLYSILDEIPIGVAIMTAEDGKMIYYNKAAEQVSNMKIPEAPPEKWIAEYGIFHGNGKDHYKLEELPFVVALKGQAVIEKPMILKNVDAVDVILSVSAKPIKDDTGQIVASVAIFQNRTEEIKIRNQLESARRLESIGRLAGGVAHDFNNMLGTVLMAADQCLKALPADHSCREDLNMIIEVGEKSAALTRQLLAFGQKQIMQPKLVNISQVIQNTHKMIGRLIGSNILINFIPSPNIATSVVDPAQLEQVVLNLCVNARDAMPTGGKITIETDIVELDEKYVQIHSNIVRGKYTVLMVTDTGAGISKDDINKIFDPFFSKKNQAYGLGLATVQGIVEQSGGHIWVYSEEGEGTTFKVYFPFVKTAEDELQSKVEEQDIALDGKETILLVEDEEILRTNISKCLVARGYHVLHASNGNAALQLADTYEKPIDLLLTDVVMPRMSGQELSIKIKEKISGIKVVFTSGYSENVIVQNGILKQGMNFLQKPASENQLLRKIRSVLDNV